MSTKNTLIRLSVLTAGTLLWAGTTTPLAAQFSFKLDPVVLEYINSDLDSNSAKFEEYRDLDDGFRIPWMHVTGESKNGDTDLDLQVINAVRDDARYSLGFGKPGTYNVFLDFNKIPHRFGNDGHMLYTQTGKGFLEIPDATQLALQTAITNAPRPSITFAFLNNLLAPYLAHANRVDLGLQRDRGLARVNLGSLGPWAFGFEYTHESRKGNRAYGGSFGFSNATEIPEPIDYDTTGAEIAGEWNGTNGGLRLGYRYSKFENNVSTLFWDNPFRITDATDPSAYTAPGAGSIGGAVHGFADLAPSNKADMLFLDGRTRVGTWVLSGNVFRETMKQNDTLLPYTLNTAIRGLHEDGSTFDPTNAVNLPVRSADQKVDVTEGSAQLGTHFGPAWDLTFRYRYYDYNDKSDRVEFPGYVRFHAVWEEVARITVPNIYTVQNAGAELGWNVLTSTHLALSYNRESWDRDFREIKSSDEDIFKLSLDTRPNDRWSIRGSYEYGDRSIGAYNTNASEDSFLEEGGVSTNLPGLRKFDEAARTYDAYKFLAQWMVTDAWNLSFGVNGRKDDYKKSAFGLVSDDIKAYNAELGYAPNDNLNFYLFGQRSDRDSFQRARQSGATPSTNPLDTWTADLKEITDTAGLGLTSKLAKSFTADVQWNWSKSNGKADLFSPPGGTPDLAFGFDNYEDIELKALLARLDYQINSHMAAGLSYRWEDYTIDSFILQGLRNYLPAALLLNANNGSYKAKVYGVNFSLYF
jgi:MtrB/PioB family decaheme-associated outer membrane protein